MKHRITYAWYLWGERRFYEAFWALLSDKCQRAGCSRQGVRGNENVIDGIVTCDYCTIKLLRG